MPGVRTVIYKDKEILVIDYNGCATDAEMLKVLYEARETILRENKPYLQLTILENAYVSFSYMNELKRIAKEMPKLAIKRAIVGVNSNARKVLLKGYNMIFGGNGMHPFDTEIEAKEWLVK